MASDLTFKLQEGVKWHDGKPFTAKDVVCTFDLLTGKAEPKLRRNPRTSWYGNVDKRRRPTATTRSPSISSARSRRSLALLASGYSPIYPCHIPAAQMRTKPIGTGPFKFVEFKQNEGIKLTKNTDYWKKGRPYLDGIEYTIVPNRATAMLSFVSGKFDITFPWEVTIPLAEGHQEPDARRPQCSRHLDERQHQPDRQPRGAAVRQSRPPARARCWRSTARPSSTS